MNKFLSLIAIALLTLTSCQKDDLSAEIIDPIEEAVAFEFNSITAIESASTSGKSTQGELTLSVNGANIRTSEILEETYETIVFGYSDSEVEGLTSGRISITIDLGENGPTGGVITLTDDNGEGGTATFGENDIALAITSSDDLGPTGGVVTIAGESTEGVALNIQVRIGA